MNQQQPAPACSSSSTSTATAITQSPTPPLSDHQKVIQEFNRHFVALSNDCTYNDALTKAVNQNKVDIVTELFNTYTNETYPFLYLYIQHALVDRLDKLFVFMGNNNLRFDVNYTPPNYTSLLDYACTCYLKDITNIARAKIIKGLLAYGASIEHYVKENDLQNVAVFIDNGANFDVSPNNQLLLYTVNQGMLEMAELLLRHQVPANYNDVYGRTLIAVPLNNGNYKMAQLLLKYNIAPFIQNSPQEIFIRAAENNDINTLLQLLRSYHPEVEHKLIKATEKHEKAIEALLPQQKESRKKINHRYKQILQNIKADALNGNAINEKGESLLTIAARNKNKHIIWLLVYFGHAHLRYCVKQGDTATVEYVLTYLLRHFTLQELQLLLTKAREYHHDDTAQKLEVFIKTMQEHDAAGIPPQEPDDLTTKSENKFKAAMEHYAEGFQHQPQLPHHTYTQAELDFWFAVAWLNNNEAQKLLETYPSIRLAMPNRPCPLYNIVTYALCKNNSTLITYLLKHHFAAIYPLIFEIVCTNKNPQFIERLIKLGLNVNQPPKLKKSASSQPLEPYEAFFQATNAIPLLCQTLDAAHANPADYKKLRLLFQSGASLVPVLEASGYEINARIIELLNNTFKPMTHSEKAIFLQTIKQQSSNKTPDMWDFGVALYKALTGQQPSTIPEKTSLPEPATALPKIITTHITNFAKKPPSHSKAISTMIKEIISFYKQSIATYMQQQNARTAQSSSSVSSVSSSTIQPRLSMQPSLTETYQQPFLQPLHRDDSQRSENLAALLPKHASQ